MARNGSGVMSIPSPDFVAGTVISSTDTDANNADIVAEITNSIAADGQTTISADIPFNAKKITGLAAGVAATDAANLAQIQAEGYIWCGVMTGTKNAGILTPAPAIAAYIAGMRFAWLASANVNDSTMTVAISGLSTIAVQNDLSALASGDHAANKLYVGIMDTTSTIQIQRHADVSGGSSVTLGTPVVTTSGTSIDITNISSGAKRIDITLDEMSTNGTSIGLIQIGPVAAPETSGYTGAGVTIRNAASTLAVSATDGFLLGGTWAAADLFSGVISLVLQNSSTNVWCASGSLGTTSANRIHFCGGAKPLAGELTQIRLTTQGGSDAFDNGAMNIVVTV